MGLPLLPDRHRPDAWKRGQFLPARARSWTVAGFPGFTVDEAGTVWREAYTDRRGHRRGRHEVVRKCVATTYHFRLFREGVPVAISQKKLRKLLTLAE
ncbi:hypothetical protein ACVWYF_004129 [Hymenobacter sp. UYAg731]